MKINLNNLDKFENNKFERIKRKKPNFTPRIDKKRKQKHNGSSSDFD